MSEAGESRGYARAMLPYLLGALALLLMLIPQLALQYVYHLITRCALAGLVTYLAAARSARQGILFALLMGALAWALDLDEGAMIAFFTATGAMIALVVGRMPGPVYARVAVACLIGAVVLVGCVAGLMLWRKESALVKAIQIGFASEWHTIAAGLAGGMAGGYIAGRE